MSDLTTRLNRWAAELPRERSDLLAEAVDRLKTLEWAWWACSAANEDVCQTLGKALGYPWFKDDQENFPGSTEAHGVCVGEHVAGSIAAEAAGRLDTLAGLASAPDQFSAALLAAHNDHRARNGVPPLRWDARLQAAAQFHASYMARVGRVGHQGIGDGTPWYRVSTFGYDYGAAGENVASGFPDGPAVMGAWMNSPGHRENILNGHYRDAGLAVARGGDGLLYWAVDFGSPLAAVTVPAYFPYGDAGGHLVPAATWGV